MKYLVFSDIHGNLPAFETVLKKEKDIEGYINIGDVVNYGPWSNECVQLIDSLKNTINICGNHESYFKCGECHVDHPLVQSFFNKTYSNFTETNTIKNYSKESDFNNFTLMHTLGEKEYIFRDSKIELNKNIILGHSHQQFLRVQNNHTLINPGSVGQNRKFINISEYIIWDIETGEIELKSIKFNINLLLSEMKHRKYPKECIDYYANKTIIQ